MGQSTLGRPTTGARYVLELVENEPAFVVYRGWVHVSDADLRAEVRVELPTASNDRGAASAKVEGEGRDVAEFEREAAALVKATARSAVRAGRPVPRKIARWRG